MVILCVCKKRVKADISEELIIDNVNIQRKHCTKFLGVMIDEYLDFKEHIQYIKGKISRGLGILFKCRRLFTQKTLLTLYNSFVYPYMNYCINVWGRTFDSYLDPLVKLQKKAVRVIAGAQRNSHTDPLFKKLNILEFHKIYLYSVQLFVYKYHHALLPEIFNDFFTRNDSFHPQRFTRIGNYFIPPGARTSKRHVKVTGVLTHNFFLFRLNINCSYLSYKVSLRIFLIKNNIKIVVDEEGSRLIIMPD